MRKLDKILKFLFVLQERTKTDEFNHKYKQRRLNPYNPLSYVFLILLYIVGLFAYGIIVMIEDAEPIKEFKWR